MWPGTSHSSWEPQASPSPRPLPLASLSSGQGVKPDLSLDPSLLLVILLGVQRGQPSPAPEGGSPMGTRRFLILGSPTRAQGAILLPPHPTSFLILLLSGSLPLLPPFFSSSEAAVTMTWSLLLAPPSQGLPRAGLPTGSGKSGLFVIKEEAISPPSASSHPLPVPQTPYEMFNHSRVPPALGGKQVSEPSRELFALRRVPGLHCVPKGGRARLPPGLFLPHCIDHCGQHTHTHTRPPSKTHIHPETHTHSYNDPDTSRHTRT